ncbi:MAG: NifB/NifX family molybdenum-iron cluster-binding protein [Theionarchaea archaeon]|nr:NifB/NifX family molybdenum-iron cluster-binding protein [Theionarchaea archaeon]
MKIGIPATDKTLESQVDARFGRCPYFIIVNTQKDDFKVIPNGAAQTSGGAGIQAAQNLVNEGVEAVIGANFGPNAFTTLFHGGVRIFNGSGSISTVIEQFKNNELTEMKDSNVPKKSGEFKR